MTDIDWSAPLEAVHDDGRVAEVTVTSDRRDDFILASMPNEFFTYFNRVDGRPRYPECGWHIRNTPQQTPTPDVVGIAPELVERMVAVVRALAGRDNRDGTVNLVCIRESVVEAVALRALLPEPVDGDVAFLEETARYFSNRPTDGEDRAYWSNISNAENCKRIANRLRALDQRVQ